jgi:predicted amino acid racemase
MFLDGLIRRNPALVRAAVELHQQGAVPANSYVLDLDCIRANTELIENEGKRLGVRVFAMTKQLGRNPAAIAAMADGGIDSCVAVDMECARAIDEAGSKLGHLGHLVQVPRHEALEAARLRPEYWTVFSEEKAAEAAGAAGEAGRNVDLLARIHAPGDTFYPGHEGGFAAEAIVRVSEGLDQLEGGRFAGVTTFPALLYDADRRAVQPTQNMRTLATAAKALARQGRPRVEVNAPGTTSVRTLGRLADAGATQVEPGHGLTGTTPWHATEELPERPAMLYLSEVSHQHAGWSYCFGGGLYIDPVFDPYRVTALVGSQPDEAFEQRVAAELPPADAIDYYGRLDCSAAAGDSVILGFRAQAFVTRANVIALAGVETGSLTVEGVWGPPGHGDRRREG